MGADLIEPTQVLSSLPHEASRVEVVAGTGHFLHLERPAEVNRLVIDHVTAG